MKLLLGLFIVVMTLSGCGFYPMYAKRSSLGERGGIEIAQIPGKPGHMLRRELLRDLYVGLPDISGDARLTIQLKERLALVAFREDGAASRSSVRANAVYTFEYSDQQITGNLSTSSNFNVPDAPYADIAAQEAAYERAMMDLSRLIIDDLRLKLTAKQ